MAYHVGKYCFILCFWFLLMGIGCSAVHFNDSFEPSWAFDHVMYEGELLKLKLDRTSGAGFASKSSYLFGKTGVQIKLVPGDSAGTVTAFYMSSQGSSHDELDFEFLGNSSGEPYVVQTNVYANGVGNREQRIYLWFDPTQDFHSYSFLWNRHQVVFLVDEVFGNNEKRGVAFPKRKGMGMHSSIWDEPYPLSVKHLCRDSDHEERSYVPPDVPAGHLAVYVGSCLRRRFVIKATLLNEPLFRALLEKAADEFGFHCQGGITIPCEIGEFENILFQLSRQYRYPVKNIRNEEPMGLYEDNSRCNIENDSTPLLYVTA